MNAGWTKGDAGSPCETVCGASGKHCNSDKQSLITTNELVSLAFLEAGYLCKATGGARGYEGTPFSKYTQGDCYHITDGSKSSCTGNKYPNHSPLCYCETGKKYNSPHTVHFT